MKLTFLSLPVKAFLVAFKISGLTFGGGMAMVPLFHREFVERLKWASDDDFVKMLSTALAVPGPIAVNLTTLITYNRLGLLGGSAGLAGIVTPAFLYAAAIAIVFYRFAHLPSVSAFMTGAGAAVTGLVAYAVILLGRRLIKNVRVLLLSLAVVASVVFFDVHPLVALLGATAIEFVVPEPAT